MDLPVIRPALALKVGEIPELLPFPVLSQIEASCDQLYLVFVPRFDGASENEVLMDGHALGLV